MQVIPPPFAPLLILQISRIKCALLENEGSSTLSDMFIWNCVDITHLTLEVASLQQEQTQLQLEVQCSLEL